MKSKAILFFVALFVGLQSFDLISEQNGAGMYEPTITQYENQLNVQFTDRCTEKEAGSYQ